MSLSSIFISSVMFLQIGASYFSDGNADIQVTIDNLKNEKGQIAMLLFTDEAGYPGDHSKAVMSLTVDLSDGADSFTLKDVPSGTYVLTVIHDENENTVLDTNMFGMPKEGYAVSNNIPSEPFGPPSFEKARFRHGDSETRIQLELLY